MLDVPGPVPREGAAAACRAHRGRPVLAVRRAWSRLSVSGGVGHPPAPRSVSPVMGFTDLTCRPRFSVGRRCAGGVRNPPTPSSRKPSRMVTEVAGRTTMAASFYMPGEGEPMISVVFGRGSAGSPWKAWRVIGPSGGCWPRGRTDTFVEGVVRGLLRGTAWAARVCGQAGTSGCCSSAISRGCRPSGGLGGGWPIR